MTINCHTFPKSLMKCFANRRLKSNGESEFTTNVIKLTEKKIEPGNVSTWFVTKGAYSDSLEDDFAKLLELPFGKKIRPLFQDNPDKIDIPSELLDVFRKLLITNMFRTERAKNCFRPGTPSDPLKINDVVNICDSDIVGYFETILRDMLLCTWEELLKSDNQSVNDFSNIAHNWYYIVLETKDEFFVNDIGHSTELSTVNEDYCKLLVEYNMKKLVDLGLKESFTPHEEYEIFLKCMFQPVTYFFPITSKRGVLCIMDFVAERLINGTYEELFQECGIKSTLIDSLCNTNPSFPKLMAKPSENGLSMNLIEISEFETQYLNYQLLHQADKYVAFKTKSSVKSSIEYSVKQPKVIHDLSWISEKFNNSC